MQPIDVVTLVLILVALVLAWIQLRQAKAPGWYALVVLCFALALPFLRTLILSFQR